MQKKQRVSLLFFLYFTLFCIPLFSKIIDLDNEYSSRSDMKLSCCKGSNVKSVEINSVTQSVNDFYNILFQDSVEVLIDNNFHVWADLVEIDQTKRVLIAKSGKTGLIKIETSDFIILADSFFLNLGTKDGIATNVKVHFDEGFVFAKYAEKSGNNWRLDDISYTSCDKIPAHWSINAKSATLYGNYLLRTSGIVFKVGDLPIFAWPYLALPIQGKSRSGFLLPKISYDDDLGLGIKQDFYWFISEHCDSTIGFDWRDRKGIVFSDFFQMAREQDSFTTVNIEYAIERNSFFQQRNEVIKGTTRHHWIKATDFRPFTLSFSDKKILSLLRVDFGTDKRIGFHFFNETESVEDTFNNSWLMRFCSSDKILNLTLFDGTKSWRKKFEVMTDKQIRNFLGPIAFDELVKIKRGAFSGKKELEDRIEVLKFPRFDFGSIYYKLLDFFIYRHDFFVDRITSRQRIAEKTFFESKIVKFDEVLPLDKTDSLRFFYQGDLQGNLRINDQIFNFFVVPEFQLRSKIKPDFDISSKNCLQGKIGKSAAYRFFTSCGIELIMPEYFYIEETFEYSRYVQPILKWNFTPKIYQNGWFYVDRYDKIFPKNRIEFELCNNWYWENLQIDFNISQGIDFYNRDDFFHLDRIPRQKHLLPLNLDFGFCADNLKLNIIQQYDIGSFKLLQSQIDTEISLSKFNLFLGLYYQNPELQRVRGLISDIPHFVFLGIDIPLTREAIFSYTGNFYSIKKNSFLPMEGIAPLVHKIYLNYSGHCWGINVGFEEKNYRQLGTWKSERAFVLNIKLDSLGSFSRKFKRPVTLTNSN